MTPIIPINHVWQVCRTSSLNDVIDSGYIAIDHRSYTQTCLILVWAETGLPVKQDELGEFKGELK